LLLSLPYLVLCLSLTGHYSFTGISIDENEGRVGHQLVRQQTTIESECYLLISGMANAPDRLAMPPPSALMTRL
jgi:hypothetical protein